MTPLNFVGFLFMIMMLFALYNASETGPFIFKNNEIKKIMVQRDSFKPNHITINLGDEIIWKNYDHVLRHTIVNDDPLIRNSDVLLKGDEFKIIFDRPGEYIFYSSLYPEFEKGIVSVIPVVKGAEYRRNLRENVLTVVFKLYRILLKIGRKVFGTIKGFIKSYMTLKIYFYIALGFTAFFLVLVLYKKFSAIAPPQTFQIQLST